MSLKTEKISKEDFYNLINFVEEVSWLDDREYQVGVMALWNDLSSSEEKNLIYTLLKRLEHVNDKKLNDFGYNITDKICEWNISPRNVALIATSDGNEIDGSTAGLQFLKSNLADLDDWSERLLFSNFNAALNFIKSGVTELLIFDDFIGSGKTMVKKLEEFNSILAENEIKNVRFRVLSFAAMRQGIDYIQKNSSVEVFSSLVLNKGITDFESGEDVFENKKLMIKLESMLSNKWQRLNLSNFSLGYKKCESLYKVYGNNCSNNVFPIFWWPFYRGGRKRTPLFRRLR